MKKIVLALLTLFCYQKTVGQVSGNVNYQHQQQHHQQVRIADHAIDVHLPSSNEVIITVKGMANVKADSYVAVFSVTQHGKTAEEVNALMNKRLSAAIENIKLKSATTTFVDMISFVPVYEFEVEKKIFSRKTYNEVPAGFELKKNVHISYSDPNQLSDIISVLADNEIYDLVKVDYYSSKIESEKKELMNRAKVILQEKIKQYEGLLGEVLATVDKKVGEEYKVMMPIEMYRSYDAYSNSALHLNKSATVHQVTKSFTQYYQPVVNKEFDFVINPVVLEPVIQVMYEIKLSIHRKEKPVVKQAKEYLLLTPSGEVKPLHLCE